MFQVKGRFYRTFDPNLGRQPVRGQGRSARRTTSMLVISSPTYSANELARPDGARAAHAPAARARVMHLQRQPHAR